MKSQLPADRMAALLEKVMTKCESYTSMDGYIQKAAQCVFRFNGLALERELNLEERHSELDRMLHIIAYYWNAEGATHHGLFKNYSSVAKVFRIVAKTFHDHGDFYIARKLMLEAATENDALTVAYQLLGGEYFLYVGESSENSMRFCKLFFEAFDDAVRKNLPLPMAESLVWTREVTMPLILFAHSCALLLDKEEIFPQKKWLVSLMRSALTGDETSRAYFRRYLTMLCLHEKNIRILRSSEIEQGLLKAGISILRYLQQPAARIDPKDPKIVLPDDIEEGVIAFMQEHHADDEKIRTEAEQFFAWFREHEVALQELHEKKCAEIKEHYLNALRKGGIDTIQVSLSALQRVGLESFSFYPEGHYPPDTMIEFTARKEAGAVCTFRGEFKNFKLERPEFLFCNSDGIDEDLLCKVMEHVIVDAMYLIVVSERRKKENGHNGSDSRIVAYNEHHVVRAKLRPLPKTRLGLPTVYRASQRQIDLAREEQGWEVPPDRTYVIEHTKGSPVQNGSGHHLFVVDDQFFKEVLVL